MLKNHLLSSATLVLTLLVIAGSPLHAQYEREYSTIIGSAYTGNLSYDMLERLTDEAGGRVVGSRENEQALNILTEELRAVGCSADFERYSIPGWRRGHDVLRMTSPAVRDLRCVALGYVDATTGFEAPLVYADRGYAEDYEPLDANGKLDASGKLDVDGKIVLVTQKRAKGKEQILRSEALEIAAAHGASGIVFMNHKQGHRTLMGMGNFHGDPTSIPAFSITWEEGMRLRRLMDRKIPVTMYMEVTSECLEINTANVVITLPGKSDEKVVVGAHFDSWDTGQGAIDNGIGTAILFDMARIFQTHFPENKRTIEFVWFNGEEMGLWGSKRYIEMHRDDNIVAMINMDMTGSPRGFNAMGNEAFIPMLEKLVRQLPGFDLSRGVVSNPWTNSDQQPFFMHGVPVFTLQAHLDEMMVKYYHAFGDTFDKVNKKYLSEATAVLGVLTWELANNPDLVFHRRNEQETIEWLRKHKLEKRLKKQGEWFFEE